MVYVLLYIVKLIQILYRSRLGAYSKYEIKYNHSDIDVSKIYIIVKIIELNSREHTYMDQLDYLAACNRNAR